MQWLPSFVHWFSRTPLISSGTVSFNSVERCSPEPCSGRVHSSHSIEISTQLHQSTLPPLRWQVSNRPPNILLWIVNLDQQVFESFSWIVLTNLSWAQPIFTISSPNNINQSIHHLKIVENSFVTNILKIIFYIKYFEDYFVTNILKIISWLYKYLALALPHKCGMIVVLTWGTVVSTSCLPPQSAPDSPHCPVSSHRCLPCLRYLRSHTLCCQLQELQPTWR